MLPRCIDGFMPIKQVVGMFGRCFLGLEKDQVDDILFRLRLKQFLMAFSHSTFHVAKRSRLSNFIAWLLLRLLNIMHEPLTIFRVHRCEPLNVASKLGRLAVVSLPNMEPALPLAKRSNTSRRCILNSHFRRFNLTPRPATLLWWTKPMACHLVALLSPGRSMLPRACFSGCMLGLSHPVTSLISNVSITRSCPR